MTTFRWLIRTLWFFRWITLGIVLAAATASAVLGGSLLTGDSVHRTLREQMRRRLGRTQFVLSGEDLFFRPQLADEITARSGADAAPVVMLTGWAENADGSRRVNSVNVIGVDASLAKLSPSGRAPRLDDPAAGVVVNEALARRLDLRPGDPLVFAVRRQGGLAADSIFFPESHLHDSRRLTVAAVADENEFGPLSFYADTAAAMNIFLPREQLARWIDQGGKANAVLIASGIVAEEVQEALRLSLEPEDLALEVRRLEGSGWLEVRSRRVFIKEPVARRLQTADPSAVGVLSYFVNELRSGDHAVPYSIVSAVGAFGDGPWNLYTLLADDEIVLNEWTASRLRADAGDTVTLRYYVPASSRAGGLEDRSRAFKVRAVVPMMGTGADPTLMPDFPELADVENCRDWDPGIPIDLSKIRPEDEAYWDAYRGSPKAFVSLAAAQAMWANPYGALTAVRYAQNAGEAAVTRALREDFSPSDAGLAILDVAAPNRRSAVGMTDFAALFAGLSFFLVLSAVLLAAMIFYFAVEREGRRIGLLRAVGLTTGRVRRMIFAYGLLCAVVGALLGMAVAVGYTQLILMALRSLWSGAVADASVRFFFSLRPLLIGAAVTVVSAAAAMCFTLRRLTRRPPRELLAGREILSAPPRVHTAVLLVGILSILAAAGLVAGSLLSQQTNAAGIFFSAAGLLLLGFLLMARHCLGRAALASQGELRSLRALALRNTARRAGRSTAVLAVMACGVFLTAAVGLNQKSAPADLTDPQGPTGGFTLMAEAGIPVLHDLADPAARKELGLDEGPLREAKIVSLRLRAGEHAGCLNLNRASQPRLLGVSPEILKSQNAFSFQSVLDIEEIRSEESRRGDSSLAGGVNPRKPGQAESQAPKGRQVKTMESNSPWDLLNADLGPDVVPAVGDIGTVYWGLGLRIGDTLPRWDSAGRPFKLRIVALMHSSVLQGNLLISEDHFTRRFEDSPGRQVFLIRTDPAQADEAAALLTRRMRSKGMEVVSAAARLAELSTVENTYLAIFLVLGGLGLLLGTAGLALVVWLNVMDRRGELAMMRAVGFSRAQLTAMLEKEHAVLLLAAVAVGAVSALVAVLPALAMLPSRAGLLTLAVLLAAILLTGRLWIRLAARAALAGPALDALRSE